MSHGLAPILFVIVLLAVVWAVTMFVTIALLYAEGERNHNV